MLDSHRIAACAFAVMLFCAGALRAQPTPPVVEHRGTTRATGAIRDTDRTVFELTTLNARFVSPPEQGRPSPIDFTFALAARRPAAAEISRSPMVGDFVPVGPALETSVELHGLREHLHVSVPLGRRSSLARSNAVLVLAVESVGCAHGFSAHAHGQHRRICPGWEVFEARVNAQSDRIEASPSFVMPGRLQFGWATDVQFADRQ